MLTCMWLPLPFPLPLCLLFIAEEEGLADGGLPLCKAALHAAFGKRKQQPLLEGLLLLSGLGLLRPESVINVIAWGDYFFLVLLVSDSSSSSSSLNFFL